MPETVLVTGGTGFLAGWTIVELLRGGFNVRATVRDPVKADRVRRAVAGQIDPSIDLDDRLSFALVDLLEDAGWDIAAQECICVLHIASPLGAAGLGDDALIRTAVDGTRRVLAAALRAGARRVVFTSSTAACTPARPLKRPIDETDWTDPGQKTLAAYRRSKVLAERAAWDFMAGKPMEFVALLPGAIFGPVLDRSHISSAAIVQRLLQGQPPVLPRLAFNITDVRDLAKLHVRAMQSPEAAGERFIVLGEALWYADVASTIRARLGPAAARVPTRRMPDLLARTLALVSPQMRALLPLLGRTQSFSTDKARQLLGYTPRPAADTVADCAVSLILKDDGRGTPAVVSAWRQGRGQQAGT